MPAIDYFDDILLLLRRLIATPSFSNEEDKAADLWEEWLRAHGADVRRFHNNVYAPGKAFDPSKPLLLLNSHLDTVRPVSTYTRNPFEPTLEGGKLYGLGSNDAGAAGVALAASFLELHQRDDLPVNLILAISASEERMGELGMRALLPHLREKDMYPDMAIVGEPTSLQGAIAERGLVVVDAEVEGKAGHAARNEGINAISRAVEDISALNAAKFDNDSPVLGPLKVNVTVINAGSQHNVIPDKCSYVVDVRTTDTYPNEDIVPLLEGVTRWSRMKARSTRVKPSVLRADHPLFKASVALGLNPFVSPTTSDMALMHDIPSLKIGPGESARSHSADEFIELREIKEALDIYPRLICKINMADIAPGK